MLQSDAPAASSSALPVLAQSIPSRLVLLKTTQYVLLAARVVPAGAANSMLPAVTLEGVVKSRIFWLGLPSAVADHNSTKICLLSRAFRVLTRERPRSTLPTLYPPAALPVVKHCARVLLRMDSPAVSDWPTLLTSTFPTTGVPVPASQALASTAVRARTRTRYSVVLVSPVISAVVPVPLCDAATQPSPGEGVGPVCTSAPSAAVPASAEV